MNIKSITSLIDLLKPDHSYFSLILILMIMNITGLTAGNPPTAGIVRTSDAPRIDGSITDAV